MLVKLKQPLKVLQARTHRAAIHDITNIAQGLTSSVSTADSIEQQPISVHLVCRMDRRHYNARGCLHHFRLDAMAALLYARDRRQANEQISRAWPICLW